MIAVKDRTRRNPTLPAAIGVELVWLPSSGGPRTAASSPRTIFRRPHFVVGDSSRIYVTESGGLTAIRWDGTDPKIILRAGGAGGRAPGTGGAGSTDMTISPDGQRVLVQSGVHVFVVQAVPLAGAAPVINVTNPAQSEVPVRKLTTYGGEFATWSRDSKQVVFSLAHSLFTFDLAAAEAARRDSVTRADSVARTGGRGGGGRGAAAKPIYEPTRTM